MLLAVLYHMSLRICICCGESMPATGESSSQHRNVCASCSSLLDGMEGGGRSTLSGSTSHTSLEPEQQPANLSARVDAATADSTWVRSRHQP